ncbi:hypothetical protein RCL1_006112 [Eukaryota sp. TZLM3-RCL]
MTNTITSEPLHFPDGAISSPYEAEQYIKSLKKFSLDQVASPDWMKQRSVIEKLNVQAHQSAQAQQDEFVVDLLLSYFKVPVLIEELLTLDVWITSVFKKQVSKFSELQASPKCYFVLFHISTLSNLLQIVFYHKETISQVADLLLDLGDYCLQKLITLSSCNPLSIFSYAQADAMTDKLQYIMYGHAINCLFLLRFITDARDDLPLSVPHYFLSVRDLPCLVVHSLESRFWVVMNREKRSRMTWNGSKFEVDNDISIIHKVEATLYLILHNLFCTTAIGQKYEITGSRKDSLLKVSSLINSNYLDQLPVLIDIQSHLEQITFLQPQSSSSSFLHVGVVEEPQFMSDLARNDRVIEVAVSHIPSFFNQESLKELTDVAQLYTAPGVAEVLERPRCGDCGAPAKLRCSQCKAEWYCDRTCQQRAWKRHKHGCKKVAEALKEEAKQLAEEQVGTGLINELD